MYIINYYIEEKCLFLYLGTNQIAIIENIDEAKAESIAREYEMVINKYIV